MKPWLRSAGVYGVYVFQMTAQAVETYGELGWTQLKGAFNTTIALSNMVPDDAKWFSESVLGEATEVTQGRNVQRDRFRVLTDRGGQSQSETKRALLTPDEVMNLRADELLVKMPQRPPARLTQRRYFDDHEVKRRAPAKGVSWIPPLGPPRQDGPLEPPIMADTPEEAAGAAAIAHAGAAVDQADPFDDRADPSDDQAAAALLDDMNAHDPADAFLSSVSG